MNAVQIKSGFAGEQIVVGKEVANILVQVGKFALVRMNKKLKDKISTCSRPISLDIEQKLVYLALIQDNLAYFGEVLIKTESLVLEYLATPRTEEEVAVIFLEYYNVILHELKGVGNLLHDTLHFLDLNTFETEKGNLTRLPQNSYNAVFNFYQNFTTYTNAFNRLYGQFTSQLSEETPDIMNAITSLSQIAGNTSKMIAATGNIFDG